MHSASNFNIQKETHILCVQPQVPHLQQRVENLMAIAIKFSCAELLILSGKDFIFDTARLDAEGCDKASLFDDS